MNDNDKAGRYLVKCDAAGFVSWLLDNPEFQFDAWIDARRIVLPNQGDLTNDLVAAVRNGEDIEGICIELESKARADAVGRLLMYEARLWTEPRTRDSLPLSCVSGVIVDLTGRSPACDLTMKSAAVRGCRLELIVSRRCLADEDAQALRVQDPLCAARWSL